MLSRRLVLAGPALVGVSRTAAAQSRQEDTETDLVLLSADNQAEAVQAVNTMAARLGQGGRLHAEAGEEVLESAARLNRRPMAVAVLPSVALSFMTRSGLPEQAVYGLHFIARVGVSEFHVLASKTVGGLHDLAGQKVAVGPRGSATLATASIVLERAGIRVDPLYLDYKAALTGVLRRDIPAMMLLAPKPARLFFELNLSDGVHFLPVPGAGVPETGLFPAQILQADYPLLGGGEAGLGQPVPTPGVPLVLACYGWAAVTPMAVALARLSDLLNERGSGLRGFDMLADVPRWKRYPPVADWLARGRTGTIQDAVLTLRRSPSRDTGRSTPEPQAAPPTGVTTDEKERLFQQFLNWRQRTR